MSLLESVFGDGAEILRERDFQTLLLANTLPPLGTSVLSPILDSLIGPFGTSAANIGLVISFFTAPAIVMIPIAGNLSDRYGRKPILVASLVLFGTAGLSISLTTEFRVILGLRLLQGVAFGGISPVIITSLGDIYDGTQEAVAQGIRFTETGLTQTVFPLLSGVLVVVGWQFPFLLYAIAFPIAAAAYLWFEEPVGVTPANHPASDGGDMRSQLRALIALVRQRRVFVLVVARGLPLVVWFGFLTYNSIMVVRILDGTPTQAGILVAIGSLTYAVAASQAGRVTAAFDTRLYPLVAANLLLGAGYVVFLFAPNTFVAGSGIVVAGLGFGILLSLYRSIITGLASDSLRGSLVSLAEAFGRVVATATPVFIGGWVAFAAPEIGLSSAMQAAGLGTAVVSMGGGIVCLLIARASPPVQYD